MNVPLTAKLIACAAVLSAPLSFTPGSEPVDGRFDVGGRSIRLACQGEGAPVTVIDAGMGPAPVEDPGWRGIAMRVSKINRVCLYDRAGLGGSDPAQAGTRTSVDAAQDVHAVLSAASVKGPYLLVRHSLGGLHAQVFAAQYPEDTAGLVLVSTTYPDQFSRWLALLPPPAPHEEKAVTEARAFLNSVTDPAHNEERLHAGERDTGAPAGLARVQASHRFDAQSAIPHVIWFVRADRGQAGGCHPANAARIPVAITSCAPKYC